MKQGKLTIIAFQHMLVLVILAGSIASNGQVKLKKTKIDNFISMKLPVDLKPMSEDDMWQRASSYRKPIALYTDLDRNSEFSVNHAFSRWEEGDIVILKSMYKANIDELFDVVKYTRDEVQNINGRDYAVFEFVSTIRGDPGTLGKHGSIVKYYYIQYTIEQGGTLVFNFSCQNWVKDDWAPVVETMMASIVIK